MVPACSAGTQAHLASLCHRAQLAPERIDAWFQRAHLAPERITAWFQRAQLAPERITAWLRHARLTPERIPAWLRRARPGAPPALRQGAWTGDARAFGYTLRAAALLRDT